MSIYYTVEKQPRASRKEPPMNAESIKSYVELYTKLRQDITSITMQHSKKKPNVQALEKFKFTTYLTQIQDMEHQMRLHIERDARKQKIFKSFLKGVDGIGEMITASLIAHIQDISKFDTISALWQYAGLGMNRYCDSCKAPTHTMTNVNGVNVKKLTPHDVCQTCHTKTRPILQKPTSGYLSNYKPTFKVLCWNIATSFVKQSSTTKYRAIYDTAKSHEHTDTKLHAHNRALRKVAKAFLADLWVAWRTMDGLPITDRYAVAILHQVVKA